MAMVMVVGRPYQPPRGCEAGAASAGAGVEMTRTAAAIEATRKIGRRVMAAA